MDCHEKVSIIMGAYNCSDTIGAAIESILHQTYPNWELIIGDDGSDDDTYQIAEAYRRLFPDKIILFRNERNMKLAATLNRCLDYASGYYVARMDGDDISLPERLSKQVAFYKETRKYRLLGRLFIPFVTAIIRSGKLRNTRITGLCEMVYLLCTRRS